MSELIRDGPGGEYRVDHSAAVKEFSRSTADKSQLLPHELRTESALEGTVLYLCHKISPIRPDQGLVHIPKQQTGSRETGHNRATLLLRADR